MFIVAFGLMPCIMAQAPIKFSYKTIVRDASGSIVGNRLVHVKISIIAKSFEGEVVYAEHSSAMTDRSGEMSLVIGEGVPMTGYLERIDWSNGPYYMRCDIDPKGGNNYAISSAQELISVPYALYAAGGDYNALSNRPSIMDSIRAIMQTGITPKSADENSNMGNHQIKNLAAPTDNGDAVSLDFMRQYVQQQVDSLMQIMAGLSQRSAMSSNEPTSHYTAKNKKKTVEIVAPMAKDGVLTGYFSVSATKQVRFSQGNLQYSESGTHPVLGGGIADGTYRFAPSQYADGISDAGGWSSHLVWGSTGCGSDGEIGDACFDWGLYNGISNGGNIAGQWRMLTIDEWNYLRSHRTNAHVKCGLATIEGQGGLVILPDIWSQPSEVKFLSGSLRGFATNTYSAYQWSVMENAGAVFLPAAGSRTGSNITNSGSYGSYWSSSVMNSSNIYSFDFYSTGMQTTGNHPSLGQSVRLVQDKQ